jgi:hypothetical protein
MSFVETGFNGRTDFTVAQYSVTNNGVMNNNPFRFQDQ